MKNSAPNIAHGRRLTAGGALRYFRIAAGALMLAAITMLLTASGASLVLSLRWAAKIQIVPLAISGAVAGLVIQALIALIFGRIYCSTICPLGVAQDVAAWRPGAMRNLRRRYSAPRTALRWAFLGVAVAAAVCSLTMVTALLDPYSTFARFATLWLRPVVAAASGAPVVGGSWLAAAIALAVMAAVMTAARRTGRTVCNTICPAGTFLGFFSRYAILHFDIDTDLCTNCRKCEHVCKGHCIDLADHVVDGSRCVVCFDCTAVCPDGAIRYTTRRKRLSLPMMQRVNAAAPTPASAPAEPSATSAPTSEPESAPVKISRRKFMATGLILASTPLLTRAEDALRTLDTAAGRASRSTVPVSPPGRRSLKAFHTDCTACGLCIGHCPGGVLRPAGGEYGWRYTMQPLLDFDRGHCLYDCTLCTELCPTGALEPLTAGEKHIFIIGHARVDADLCIGCGACSRACPRQVIAMTHPAGRKGRLAVVADHGCIGCGACRAICPVKPVKAIVINGVKPQ